MNTVLPAVPTTTAPADPSGPPAVDLLLEAVSLAEQHDRGDVAAVVAALARTHRDSPAVTARRMFGMLWLNQVLLEMLHDKGIHPETGLAMVREAFGDAAAEVDGRHPQRPL